VLRTGGHPVPADARAVRAMLDHAAYYFVPERAAAFRYVLGGAAPRALDDALSPPADTLDACARRLAEAGVRVALVDVTSADVATTPLRVFRAVSPGLQPIAFGHGRERALVARLAASARAAGDEDVLPVW
jgi:ribosomal protein S12 methylthiotransferase accessory factor